VQRTIMCSEHRLVFSKRFCCRHFYMIFLRSVVGFCRAPCPHWSSTHFVASQPS
jgi:hypothetical protein